MSYTYQTLTDDDLIRNANIALEALAIRLEKDGVIKNRDEILNKYVFTVAKRGMFTAFFDKLFGFKQPEEGKLDPKYFVLLQIPQGTLGTDDGEEE